MWFNRMQSRWAISLKTLPDSGIFLYFCIIKASCMESKIININPEILGGTPVFYGTRVPIKNLFDYLETGESIDEFLKDFESVHREQVVKVLEMSQTLIQTSTKLFHENLA
jgi:uncharacterized protein (DUF433 family)